MLLAPSVAGLLLACAALLAFLSRTPLRLVLLRYRRAGDRSPTAMGLARAHLATRVAAFELVAIGAALVGALVSTEDATWLWPLAVAAPLFALALWFDLRSSSRHAVAETAGSVAVAAVVAMGALAGGAPAALAVGAWIILAARVLSSIPHVRAQVLRIHGREAPALPGIAGDAAAVACAVVAVVLEPSLLLGGLSIGGLVIVQRITLVRPPRPAKVLGVRQMLLGFTVVGATALGAWLL